MSGSLSLEEIIVNVQVYGEDGLRSGVEGRIRKYGWTIEVTKREIPKEV